MHRTAGRRARPKLRGVLTAVCAVGVLVLAACGSDDSASGSSDAGETTTITVGVIPILDVAPLYAGIDQGFFKAEGLELKLELAQGGAAIVPAVVSGQYQFGFSNSTSLLLATSKGLALKAVTAGVASTGKVGEDFGAVLVTPDSPIKEVADLAGKRVAVNTLNNINTTTINNVVREAGADPATIEYVELPFPEIAPAIAKGDVDAGQVVEPFVTVGEGQGMRQLVSNFAATDPDLMVGLYFTSADYAAKNAEVVAKFTAAMKKSLEFADQNPDAVRKILGTYTTMKEDVQGKVILPHWPTEIDRKSIDLLADLAVADGLMTTKPDLTALLP
jgi:NitT/TauT family transport system substrate-binding protein